MLLEVTGGHRLEVSRQGLSLDGLHRRCDLLCLLWRVRVDEAEVLELVLVGCREFKLSGGVSAEPIEGYQWTSLT